ncbi:antireceptor [Streptococcus phage P7951]|uniref:Antireceptor n=1 Tax=Streptococcus phage P7951 TaxID=1971436 RepID=A0A286QQK2_9CAUD|nr:antireceptor [Streptococcus phage P7951]ARU14203.1 antireceptor [Streptococcus phage P7951]
MLLTIHDANLQKIGFIDNEKQETLNFYDDTWTRNLETASSTFEFTVSKKQLLSDTGNKHLYNQLNERSFVSFKYKGKTYLFNIMKTEENERWLRCYCENLNLELINEYTNAYKADRPRSFAEYLDVFEIPQFAMVKVGVNEISDQKRMLEWEGQETKLARLLSLANKFDAEVEFVTQLNDDSSIKQLVLNVYHKADDSHTGVGRIRGDIRLTFEKNIKSMTRKIDKTEVYTLVVPYGKSKETHEGEQEVRVYIDSLPPWEEKNDEGIVIFKQDGIGLYAPHAADLYPSTFGVSTQSNKWIRKDLEVDSDNPSVIHAAGIANLRKHAYPAITYEVDGFVDVEIGDTITIHDKGFTPALDIRARAVEQKISFSNPTNNKTTFGNFKELENRTSGDLRSVFEQMVENSRPYNILVSTDNGVMFKNNTGRSTISPTLKRGNQTVPATYRFVIDGSIVSSGLTYTVKASDITKPTVVTISAWVDNKEVASEEVTFLNVSDGKQGPQGDQGIPGPKGADGKTQYTHIAYADTISGSGFSQTDVNKAYIGMYQDFNADDSKNPQDYRWSKWKGSDGRDGIPGKAGADGRTPYVHFAYADSADGQKGFSLTQTGHKRYLGVLTNFFKEDSTNPSDYTWNDTAGSVSVGGRNLLVKTNQGITNWDWTLSDGDKSVEEVKVDGIRAVKLIKGSTTANTGWNYIQYNGLLRELIQPKSKYVLSFDVKPSVDVTFYATLTNGDFTETLADTAAMTKALANQWNKVSCVLTSKETLPNIAWKIVHLAGMPTTNGNWVIIKNIKLEEGDIPTQWTPAIEDIQDEIDSKADAAMTTEQINALNERAAIIQAEVEARASAEILNKWIKNYKDFVKANETERAAAEKALVSSSQRVSTIAKELGELSDRWNFIDTYMSTSNDGLVIGKNDGSSSIMFNPNGRISMYSAGSEVMYISQGVIHIENGIFSKTIQVGRYREEQYHLNPDMNVIRYVGGF